VISPLAPFQPFVAASASRIACGHCSSAFDAIGDEVDPVVPERREHALGSEPNSALKASRNLAAVGSSPYTPRCVEKKTFADRRGQLPRPERSVVPVATIIGKATPWSRACLMSVPISSGTADTKTKSGCAAGS